MKDKKAKEQETKEEPLHPLLKKLEKNTASYKEPSSCLMTPMPNTKALLTDRRPSQGSPSEKGTWKHPFYSWDSFGSYSSEMISCQARCRCSMYSCVCLLRNPTLNVQYMCVRDGYESEKRSFVWIHDSSQLTNHELGIYKLFSDESIH